MCQPDTTVEVLNPELGGVTGFGTEHQCRDWNELVAWTTEWQAWQQEPRRKGTEDGMGGSGGDMEHVGHAGHGHGHGD